MSHLKDCGFFNDGKWIKAQMKHPGVAAGLPHTPATPAGDLPWEKKLLIKENSIVPYFYFL